MEETIFKDTGVVYKDNKGRAAAVTIGSVMLCVVIMSVAMNPMSLYTVAFVNELGLSQSQATIVFSYTGLSGFFCAFFAGSLFKRFNFNLLVSLAVICGAGGLLMWSFAQNFVMCFIGSLLLGAASKMGTFMPTQMALVNWYKKGAGKIVGSVGAVDNLASAVIIVGIGSLFVTVGWRTCALIQAAVVLALGLIASIFLIRYSPESCGMRPIGDETDPKTISPTGEAIVEEPSIPVKTAIKSFPFWALMIVCFLQTCIMQGFMSQIAITLSKNGVATVNIAFAVSGFSIAAVISKLLFGAIIDKFSLKVGCLFSYACIIAGIILIIFADSPLKGFVAAFMFGFIAGPLTMVGVFASERLFGKKSLAYINGYQQAATAAGGITGGTIVAAILFLSGGSIVIPMMVLVVFAVICAILASICFGKNKYLIQTVKK